MISSAMASKITYTDSLIKRPLILQSRGSFFVGGDKVEQTKAELGQKRPADCITKTICMLNI